MRSFFKKPAWADTADEPSAPEFYRRSHQTYNDILKANRQQRSKDAAKSAPRTVEESTKDSTAILSPKRRRVSGQTDEPDESKEPQANTVEAEDVSDVHDSPHHTDHDDESNESEISEHPESPSGVEEEITDDGAVEQEHEALNKSKSASPEIQIVEVNQVPQKTESKVQNQEGSLSSRLTTTPLTNGEAVRESTAEKKDETTVEILVTSELEHTRPLVVRRHLTQRFRDVRLAWCVRQGFDQRMSDSVYLTWNKRRLFDVTTCRSLNINVLDPSQSSSFSDDLDDDGPSAVLRIHVEAVTDDLLKAKAAAVAAAAAEQSHNTDMTTKSQGLSDGIDDEEQQPFHITLKSRGYDELRLKVLPQTPISQILASFRSRRSISPDIKISLSFDGDVLDANMKLQDYEVTDMDLLDVNLR